MVRFAVGVRMRISLTTRGEWHPFIAKSTEKIRMRSAYRKKTSESGVEWIVRAPRSLKNQSHLEVKLMVDDKTSSAYVVSY